MYINAKQILVLIYLMYKDFYQIGTKAIILLDFSHEIKSTE